MMSLVQILKEKKEEEQQQTTKLTPDTIFPKWASVFDYISSLYKEQNVTYYHAVREVSYRTEELNLDITKTHRCVVGESHGWSGSYGFNDICDTCRHFSSGGMKDEGIQSFISLEWDIRTGKVTDWRNHPTVTSFLEHWSNEHI